MRASLQVAANSADCNVVYAYELSTYIRMKVS